MAQAQVDVNVGTAGESDTSKFVVHTPQVECVLNCRIMFRSPQVVLVFFVILLIIARGFVSGRSDLLTRIADLSLDHFDTTEIPAKAIRDTLKTAALGIVGAVEAAPSTATLQEVKELIKLTLKGVCRMKMQVARERAFVVVPISGEMVGMFTCTLSVGPLRLTLFDGIVPFPFEV